MLVGYAISVGRQELLLKELDVLRKLSPCYNAVVKKSLKAWIDNVEVVLTLYLTWLRAVLSCMDGFFCLKSTLFILELYKQFKSITTFFQNQSYLFVRHLGHDCFGLFFFLRLSKGLILFFFPCPSVSGTLSCILMGYKVT